MKPLTASDLTGRMCEGAGCTMPAHRLKAACHMKSGLRVSFEPSGVLRISCDECGKLVCEVAVAP